MRPYFHQLTLPTPYGEATFGTQIYPHGNVRVVSLPLGGLPPSVFKLTYGNEWEAAGKYFRDLAATLPFRIRASLAARANPPELSGLIAGYRAEFPESTPGSDYARFWAGHAEWTKLFSFDEEDLHAALDRFRQRGVHHDLSCFSPFLLPYLLTLFPTASHRTAVLLYATIGTLGTVSARDYLLEELESEGRHPFTSKILRALTNFRDEQTARRLFAVYAADKFDGDGLEAHLLTVSRFGPDLAGQHVESVLPDHPEQVDHFVVALREMNYAPARIARLLREAFQQPREYPDLDRLLLATNGLDLQDARIDLAAMNARVDDPDYLDLPPVNWPQQLEVGWTQLVLATPPPEALAVIGAYLLRPEPRLQRNALLQLKVLLQEHPVSEPLPLALEERLRQLVASRFDKVYVEALNVLSRRDLRLHDRASTLDAVLAVSIGSRYRFVVLTALRRIGHSRELKERARKYLAEQIDGSTTDHRLEQIAGLLPFVEKYLGDVTLLRKQLSERMPSSC